MNYYEAAVNWIADQGWDLYIRTIRKAAVDDGNLEMRIVGVYPKTDPSRGFVYDYVELDYLIVISKAERAHSNLDTIAYHLVEGVRRMCRRIDSEKGGDLEAEFINFCNK